MAVESGESKEDEVMGAGIGESEDFMHTKCISRQFVSDTVFGGQPM